MVKRFVSFIFVFLVFISFSMADTSKVQLILNKSVLKKNEKLCFTLKNNSNEKIYLPDTAPWVIIGNSGKYKGKVVYAPAVLPVITPLEPNQSKKWCWDLKNFNGLSVPSGKYIVRFTIFIGKEKVFISKEFEVKPLYSIIDDEKNK